MAKFDDHDGVLFDNADEQDNAQERVEVEILAEEQQCEKCTESCGGKTGEDRDGVDQALVKNAEDEIDDHHRDDEQQAETFEGALKLRGGPLKGEVHTGRSAEFGGGSTHS